MATASEPPAKSRRIRTPEEAFQAGWDDGANDRAMSRDEIERIAALWRPYYKPSRAA